MNRSVRLRLVVEVLVKDATPQRQADVKKLLLRAGQGVLVAVPGNVGVKHSIERETGKIAAGFEWRRL